MSDTPIRVTVWNEFVHERTNRAVAEIYPDGIHATIAQLLNEQLGSAVATRTATLDEPQHGLAEAVLAETDVLTWWGHAAHDRVADEVVDRVQRRVLEGMGLIVLHSGHASKIFRRMMGTIAACAGARRPNASGSGSSTPRIRSSKGSRASTSSFTRGNVWRVLRHSGARRVGLH